MALKMQEDFSSKISNAGTSSLKRKYQSEDPSKFEDEFLKASKAEEVTAKSSNLAKMQFNIKDVKTKQLFEKELTPSDVGRFNRLLIPKFYAEKFLPCLDEYLDEFVTEPSPYEDLTFYDENMKRAWMFRYCYWRSSRTFVFTMGWTKFVNSNKLKANDTIRFCKCHVDHEGNDEEVKPFYIIKIDRAGGSSYDAIVEDASQSVSKAPADLHAKKVGEGEDDKSAQTEEVIDEIPQVQSGNKAVKLFGVDISN